MSQSLQHFRYLSRCLPWDRPTTMRKPCSYLQLHVRAFCGRRAIVTGWLAPSVHIQMVGLALLRPCTSEALHFWEHDNFLHQRISKDEFRRFKKTLQRRIAVSFSTMFSDANTWRMIVTRDWLYMLSRDARACKCLVFNGPLAPFSQHKSDIRAAGLL